MSTPGDGTSSFLLMPSTRLDGAKFSLNSFGCLEDISNIEAENCRAKRCGAPDMLSARGNTNLQLSPILCGALQVVWRMERTFRHRSALLAKGFETAVSIRVWPYPESSP